MATNRSYNDMCGLAHALDLVGERWALLIVRELVLGPRRYTDIRADLPGISSNVLAHRLDELAAAGVVERRTLPPPAGSAVYELTGWGQELESVVIALARWGARAPAHPSGDHLSASSLILSLRTNFDAHAAERVRADCEFHIGAEVFRVRVTDGALHTGRAIADSPEQAEATVEADPMTLAGLLYGGRDLTEAVDAEALRVHGDQSAVQRLLPLFTLPEPAAV